MSDFQHGWGHSRSNEGKAFPSSLLRKALQWFHSQPAETMQNWNTLMKAFMKEYYSPGKTQSLHNKIATFVQYHTETISEAFERFNEYTRAVPHHKFRRETSCKSSIKDSPWRQGRSSMHRPEDPSSSLCRRKLSLYSRRSWIMTNGRHPGAYIRFNPWGTSNESCKWRRTIYLKTRSTRS
jgi:hypothetical protein